MDVLTRINDAIADRCHCGCGRPLDPGSPSAYWASEGCQKRWQWQQSGAALAGPSLNPDVLRSAFAALGAGLRMVAEAYATAARAVVDLNAAMVKAGVAPESAPKDPMERALWLRRNRNTGPRAEARAPRRIEPRRSR